MHQTRDGSDAASFRYCGGGWWPATEERVLIDLEKIGTTRYGHRGAVIPSSWPDREEDTTAA